MQTMKNMAVFTMTVGAVFSLAWPRPAVAQPIVRTDAEPLNDNVDELDKEDSGFGPQFRCTAQEFYKAKYPQGQGRSIAGVCGVLGDCDSEGTRDSFIPHAETLIKTFRLEVHVFCYDDGSECVSTPTEVDNQINRLNLDFLENQDWRMEFIYEVQFHNDTRYRDIAPDDIEVMKAAYAVSPDSRLNVYVAYMPGPAVFSFATYPWDPDVLGVDGGIFMSDQQWSSSDRTLSHEVGHCLGLRHTHQSPSEVDGCTDPCYEYAGSLSDDTGDYCSDTAPTPINYSCSDPSGTDDCADPTVPWAPTNFHNYMSYTSCSTEWTPQQTGRGHCWSIHVLGGWLASLVCDPVCVHGTCTGPDSCICDLGWMGAGCVIPVCGDGIFVGLEECDDGGADEGDGCSTQCAIEPGCVCDGVPSLCVCTPATPDGPHDIQKNRFLSFAPNSGPVAVALRLELLDQACSATGKRCTSASDCKTCVGGGDDGSSCSINSDCDGANNDCEESGESCVQQSPPVLLGWIDDPFDPATDRAPGAFAATVTETMPSLRAWTEDVVHVADCQIAPAYSYAISATRDGLIFSDPLILGTVPAPQGKHWGDVVGNFNGLVWSAPNGLLNVDDVNSVIKFITLNLAPHITVLELGSEVPSWLINATDLQLVIKAFKGDPYPPPAFPTHVCEGGQDDGQLCDPLVVPAECPGGTCTGFSPTDCP